MATIERPVQLIDGKLEDLDDVMQVMESAFGTTYGEAWTRSQCSGILPMAGVALTIARDSETGAASGFSLSRSVLDDAELLLIAVQPRRQRQGIGQRLLDRFTETARSNGATRIHLEVRDGNPATEMYTAAGFAPVGRRKAYYLGGDGRMHDAVTLVCQLATTDT